MSVRTRIDSDAMELDEEAVEEDIPLKSLRKNLMEDFGKSSTNLEVGEEHMKVFLRVRPFSEKEIEENQDKKCLEVQDDHTVLTHAPKESHTYKNCAHELGKTTNKFTFSKIFNERTSQKVFFNETMLDLVKNFIDGQNCLVFTYGVTSSGKTYTIQAREPKDAGILPRALDVLFNSINGKQWQGFNLKPKMFMDVTKIGPEEAEEQRKTKEKTLKMSCDEDPDVMSLLGDDASDMSLMSQGTNTTTCSESSNVSIAPNKDSIESGELFSAVENRVREETAVSVAVQGQIRFSVWVSFAEIYNEQIFDLLQPVSKKKNARRPVLKLSDDRNGSPYVKGLKEICVFTADEAYKLLTIGKRNLQMACTKLNHQSSRRFNICLSTPMSYKISQKNTDCRGTESGGQGDPNIARVSMLSFCDLAGSERQSKTQSQGERLKEAGNINTSLLTLGRCIEMLRYNQHHKDNSKIIPFRDSKLTRLFQNFFNGRGRANMIVNVNQCASMFDETLHVFKFSAIAKQVVVPQKPVFKHRILPAPKAKPVKEVPRPSISWATPSQMKKMSSWISKGTNIPLPDDDDDDLEDQDNRQAIVELVEMVKQLEKEVAYERKEKLMLEMNIREQVCAEMMQQLVEMENDFSERLREREQIMEDFAERRIKILMDGLSATNQKPAKQDVMQDEDDEWVSSILFYQEQLKVQVEKDKELEDMKKELEEVKSQLPQQKPQQETQNSTNQDCSGDMGNSVLLENLTRQLEEAKTQIREQATEITELNEMLTEAGETFQQKETEIGKLKLTVSEFEEKYNQQKETMTDLEKTLKEGHSSLELANTKILTKEEKVQHLEDERVKLQAEIQNLKNCVGFVEETLRLKEGEVGGWRAKLEREENESFKREQALINGYKAEISNLKQQIVTLKAETRQHSPMKSPVKSPTKRRLMGNDENDAFKEDLCRQLKDLQTEFDKNSSATLEMEHALSIARSASQDLEKRLQIEKEARLKAEEDMNAVRSKQSELQDEISEFKLEKDAVNNAENKKMKDLEKESEKTKEKFEKLQSAHEHLEKRYAEKIEEIIQVDKKVSSLEEELRNMAANHQTNAAEMHEKISDLTTELQEKETELESGQEKIEELQTVCQSLREMVNTATGEVQAKESALQVMSVKVEMEKTQKQENDSLGNLQQKMKMMKKECEEMKKASGEKDMEIERMRNQKEKDLEVEKTRKEKEKDVEFQLDEKNIEIMELTEKNFESEKKVLALENLVKEKIKQLSELNDEMDKMKVAKEMLEEDLQNLEENQENMEEIANTNIQMKQTLTEYETKNTTLEEEIVEIKEKMEELQRSLQAKCEECCKLQETWEEKEIVDVSKSCKQNMEDIEKQFIDLKSTCENLRTEMCEKCNHIERLENETKDLKKKIGDETFGHEKMEQELVELNGKFELKCADLEKVNTELETKNSDLSKVLSELEEMKSKSGNLEIEHEKLKSSIEDQVRELQKENSELKENLRMSELRVKELSEEVVREHVQLVEASSCSQMQEKLESNSEQESELSRAKMSIAELKSSLHMHKTLHEKAKQEMAALKEEFDQLVTRKSDESNGKMDEKSVELNELQGRVTELMEERTQLEEKSKLLTDRDQQISAMETEMAKMSEEKQSLVGENERLQEEIESMKENIQFKEKDEQIELEKLRNEVDDEKVSRKEADNKIEKLESKLSSAREALQEKESRVTKLEKELLKLELDMAANVHNKVAELEKELDSEKEKNQRTFQETEEKHNLRMTEIVKELENQKNLLVAEKERCENYKKMVDDSQLSDCLSPGSENKTVRKLRKEKIEIENSLIQAKWHVQQLESKLKESENQPNASVSSELEKKLKKTMAELQEKDINNRKLIHDLSECHRKIENLECLKQELESKVQQKKAEVLQMSPKVSVLSEHLQRNPVPTSPTVHRELSLSQDRELTMKKQLQEASRNIAELSQKICDLDDQLMTKTKALVDAEDRIKTLQGGSAASRVSLTPSAELERLQEELSQKWDLIRDLQQDLSRKDQKLQDEAQRCKRLVNEMSEEKRKFETALSDANANEALIAHFKEALAEQEDTMSKQDVLIQQNEEEIRKLKQECDNYMMQYKSLLSGTSQSSKEIRDLSVQNARLTTDKEHLERCIKTKEEEVSKVMVEIDRLKEDLSNQKDQGVSAEKKELEEKVKAKVDSLQEMIKEKEKLNLIIQENNSELKEMEKALSESRSDCEKLRSQLDQNVSQQLLQTKKEHEDALSQMKTKIKDKDHSLRDSHKQVRQLEEELKKINDKVNDKETEMKTWKEEKDKLVQSLATIIEKQKADKTRVKELESEKTYMEEVLQDQVKTIQQLTAAKKSEDRRRKNPSGSSQPISPGSMNATISAIKQEVVETPGRRTSSRRGRKRRSVSESDLETPQSKRKGRESEISVVSEECADTSHYIKIDATPPVAARNLRKGRKKRSSVDLLREDVKENSGPKNTRASRSKSQKSEKETGKSLSRIGSIISAIKKSPIAKVKKHLEEIKEVPSPNQKPLSSPMVEVEDHGTQMSAEKVKEFTASKSKRGKRHALYKEEIQISEPMDCGTFLPARKSDEDAHKIVKRQLRGRRH